MSAAGLAGALADSYLLVVASRVCLGLGAATVGPMCSALGAGMVPPGRQGRALALVFSGMILATVLGLPLSGWLGNLTSWRVVFAAIAGLSAVVAVAVGILVRDRSGGGWSPSTLSCAAFSLPRRLLRFI